METGFDIIFFWVARMIMMGLHLMGDVPFKKVYLHAMVRDEKGEKMSKTKGNVINPLVLIDQHGADPLRFTLAAMAGQGRDIKLSVDRVEGYRGFCNKVWNATKFFHLQIENDTETKRPPGGITKWLADHRHELSASNRWVLSRLQALIPRVEMGLAQFELNESANALYEFTWHEFCDWYIEFSKLSLKEGGPSRTQTLYTLHAVLETLFRLMHPFMPFVTEELWQSLPWKREATDLPFAENRPSPKNIQTLMLRKYPSVKPALKDAESERTIAAIQAMIEAIRNFRGENSISPKSEFVLRYKPTTEASDIFLKMYETEIKSLAKVSALERIQEGHASEGPEAVIPLSKPSRGVSHFA